MSIQKISSSPNPINTSDYTHYYFCITRSFVTILSLFFLLSSCSNELNSPSNSQIEKDNINQDSILHNKLGYIIDTRPSLDQSVEYKRRINSQYGGKSTEEWITFDSLLRPKFFHFLIVKASEDFQKSRQIQLQNCSNLEFDGVILTLSSGSRLLRCEEMSIGEIYKIKVDEFDLHKNQLNIEYTTVKKHLTDSSMISQTIHKSYIVGHDNLREVKYDDKSLFEAEKRKLMGKFHKEWWK